MEYSIRKFANLSGVSTRTLRYYDEIGLLKPARLNSSGYRIYSDAQVRRLQQILFYRELDISLDEIGSILDSPGFNETEALRRQQDLLLQRRNRLNRLIRNIEKTLACEKGEEAMTDEEKFEGFKQDLLRENEQNYGNEIRQKYGKQIVDQSNQKLLGMTQEEFQRLQNLEQQLNELILKAFQTGDPAGETAQHAAALHSQWISGVWGHYTPEAHAALAQMYVDDPRFTAYYDRMQPGLAKFLKDTIQIFTKQSPTA